RNLPRWSNCYDNLRRRDVKENLRQKREVPFWHSGTVLEAVAGQNGQQVPRQIRGEAFT
ncbi:jg15205, partial [Pararge aegeria aegeria]